MDENQTKIIDAIQEAKDLISEAEGWIQATSDDVQRILRNKDTAVEHTIPIDEEGKIFIKMWIKEIPITEQLDLLELFMSFDKKGETKLKWKQYYAHVFSRMVVKTEPSFKWKDARFFNKKFLKILMDYLPNPFEEDKVVPGQISETTRKNS